MFELFDTDDDPNAPPTSHEPAHDANGAALACLPPGLPQLAPRAADEPAAYYGARVLRFLIATSCTATLDDDALTLANYAAGHTVAARNVDPAALAACNELRHTIHAVLRAREADRAATRAQLAALTHTPADDRPNEGPMARLQPAPRTQPPGGQHVALTF